MGSTEGVTNPLVILSEHAAGWRGRALSPDLERHARRAVIDWFASLCAGLDMPPATLLAKGLASVRGPGRAICYVDGHHWDVRQAALINAAASHSAEFDDIFRDGGNHPAATTISAALAVAQDRQASLAQLLAAIVAGYEVSCRIALAVQPEHYRFWHPTATIGTIGAAAAVAVLLGLDAVATGHALAIAATSAGGLQQALRGEGMTKPMHVGHAADAGCLAAMAAASGVTGAIDMLHGPVGFAAATSAGTGKWDAALATLGTRPLIAEMTFKNHGCCGHIFAALDAVTDLQRENGLRPEDIVRIHVAGYAATADICDRAQVKTDQEARFSVQYCIAALLLFGGVRLAAFTPDRLADPKVQPLMDRISVSIDADLAKAYPGQRGAKVTLTLADGRVLNRFQPTRRGDPDAPLSDAELSEKFRELAAPVLGAAAAGEFLAMLWKSDTLPGALPG